MVDLDVPVWFTDERGDTDDLLKMTRVLWRDRRFVLCEVVNHIYSANHPLDPSKWEIQILAEPILFDLTTGEAVNADYESFNVTNDISDWRPFGWTE